MRKYISFLLILFLVSLTNRIYAIKATPDPVIVTQPDGSQLSIYVRGDEYFKYKTTLDGYIISTGTDGFYQYGTIDGQGHFVPSQVRVNNISQRTSTERSFIKTLSKKIDFSTLDSQSRMAKATAANQTNTATKGSYPLTGSPKSLVILVNFSDKNFATASPEIAYTNLLNKPGYSENGGTGSAKDYFESASNRVFSPEFDVVGPYTLPQTMDYYGKNNSSKDDSNPRQMVIDACTLADAAGVDFTQYDTDGDGYVDNVFIYYAGYNEAEGGPDNSVWPHRWVLANTNTKFDGKIVYDYACTSELRGNSGSNMCGIGTFCHEFGHVLGLPDYYNTNGNYTYNTLSYWNIMDSGPYLNSGRTPPTYSAYDRFYLNWLTPVELKTAQNVNLNPLDTSNKAYLITQYGNHNLNGSSPSPVEFFTLENRQQEGWDSYLPGHGLLISRIYYNSTTWYNNTVNNNASAMGYDIIEADGVASDNSLPGDPFPGTSSVSSYSPTLRAGTNIGKPLTYIAENSGVISFRFMGGGDVPTLTETGTLSQFSTVQDTPSAYQVITLTGKKLIDDVNFQFVYGSHFEMRLQSETENDWRKTITLSPVDSIIDSTKIMIRYNPTTPSYSEIHSDIISISSDEAEPITITVTGKSTRPVYVVAPVAGEATNVTEQAFIANWESVYDASGYYLTVYGLSDGTSAISEGFDNGLTAPDGWTITATTLTTSLAYSGDTIPAIQFKNTGEYIETGEYILAPTALSFYAKSISGYNGKIAVDGWNGASWNNIDSVAVTTSLSGTQTIPLNASDNFIKFKLTYIKGAGYVAIDDVAAEFNQNLEMIEDNKWLTTVHDTIVNLVPARNYYYKVKVSDKTLYSTGAVKYENITDYSNLIHVTTVSETNSKVLRTNVQSDGTVVIIMQEPKSPILIYNTLGQKVMDIINTQNVVNVSGLAKNHIYIIKAGNQIAKIIL